jgi:hypothetical protein
MNLFSIEQFPELKTPDGFTPLENGRSYNDLVDEHADLVLEYNQLLNHYHELEQTKNKNEATESKSPFILSVVQKLRLFKKGAAFSGLSQKYTKLTESFNGLVTENYALSQEIKRLKLTQKEGSNDL